jgi:hypothetical protein
MTSGSIQEQTPDCEYKEQRGTEEKRKRIWTPRLADIAWIFFVSERYKKLYLPDVCQILIDNESQSACW